MEGLAEKSGSTPTGIEFNNGDRVVILGGTLAERMQHDAWMETLILYVVLMCPGIDMIYLLLNTIQMDLKYGPNNLIVVRFHPIVKHQLMMNQKI